LFFWESINDHPNAQRDERDQDTCHKYYKKQLATVHIRHVFIPHASKM